MTHRQSRRKLIVVVLLFLAVGGAAIRHFVAPPSTLRDIGTLMLLLWIPVIGNVVAWFFGKARMARQAAKAARSTEASPLAPPPVATATGPFAADLLVEFTLRPASIPAEDRPIAEGEHQCAFVVGNEGFSVRWQVPAGRSFLRGTLQVLEAQFLSPAVALPKFAPGTPFRMLVGDAFIGDGKVRDVRAAAVSPP
ncbi:MAG: hypothetical protein EOP70_17345 [Variovorax sp.]|nr:MAG: hypothetical protein EOP70_17345 [Variovorax sp.]